MTRPLRMPAAVRTAVASHALRDAPRECCGFLLGTGNRVIYALAASNASRTPLTRYEVDSREHIAVRRLLRRLAPPLTILGVYHSHPRGPAAPSSSDVRKAYVREWTHVIVDLSRRSPGITAWIIRNGRALRRPLGR